MFPTQNNVKKKKKRTAERENLAKTIFIMC